MTELHKENRVKKEMKNEVSILVTHDKLYYVVYGGPFIIQEKTMKKAEELQKKIKKLNEIKNLIKKVKDNPKENPCNAWFIHSLEQIMRGKTP